MEENKDKYNAYEENKKRKKFFIVVILLMAFIGIGYAYLLLKLVKIPGVFIGIIRK